MSDDIGELSGEVERFGDFVTTLAMQIRETSDDDGIGLAIAVDDWLVTVTQHLRVIGQALEYFVTKERL